MKVICQCPACRTTLQYDNSRNFKTVSCPKCAYQGTTAEFKEVQMKNVYCPNCNAASAVNPNKIPKIITCPKCKRTEVFSRYMDSPRITEQEECHTQITDNGSDSNALYRPGKIFLRADCGGREEAFTLKRGENTLGRMSPNSSADIQLPASDPYMSKSHAKIEVTMKSDATFEHCLSDNGSKNGTYHNDQRLQPGDVTILCPGDTIRLGHTTFVFRLE